MLEFVYKSGSLEVLVQSVDGKRIYDTGPALKKLIDKPLKMIQNKLTPINTLAKRKFKNGKSN